MYFYENNFLIKWPGTSRFGSRHGLEASPRRPNQVLAFIDKERKMKNWSNLSLSGVALVLLWYLSLSLSLDSHGGHNSLLRQLRPSLSAELSRASCRGLRRPHLRCLRTHQLHLATDPRPLPQIGFWPSPARDFASRCGKFHHHF